MEVSLQDAILDNGTVTTTFNLGDDRHIGKDRGGVLSPTSYGFRLWSGSVALNAKTHSDMEIVQSTMHALTAADGTFLICPPARINDTEVIGEVLAIDGNDRRNLLLSNAAGLGAGDWVGVSYAGGKRGLHQIYKRDGSNVFVQPPLALGVVVGDITTYGRPTIRAIVSVGGYQGPSFGLGFASGLSFSWTQSLRPEA